MTWGRNAPPYSAVSLRAPRGSNERMLAVMERTYPGSWLPAGKEQIERSAATRFRLVESKNGRLDYVKTMGQWDRVWRWDGRKVVPVLKMLRFVASDPDFRYKLEALRNGYNKQCFIREVMDHQRLVFEALP
jgi:cyclopropane-fatty-acyl-phospholipid synthase